MEHPITVPLFHMPAHVGITLYLIIGLAFLSYWVKKRISIVPNNVQSIIEIIVEFVDSLILEAMGTKGKKYFPFVATFGIYILISNLLGLIPGFIPPTANLNTTLALALVVFISTHIIGIKEHGISYLKHFVGPIWWMAPLMFPIEIIGHLSRPVSLSLRLFGNMMGHEIIVATLLLLVPFLVPLPFLILGILVSLLQAFIFTLLTMMYIGGALEEAH